MVTASLVTLEAAKLQCRLTSDHVDAELTMHMEAATELLVKYLKIPDHGYTVTTLPSDIRKLILLQVEHYWKGGTDLAPGIEALAYIAGRRPALA